MANKIISNLTPKTSPASADVLAIEDTEATKKIDYNALADAILNKLTSKTYSVAGSTQTLINAIDALNSNLWSLTGGTDIPENSDLNNYKTIGNYRCTKYLYAITIQNSPITDGAFILKIESGTGEGNNYVRQIIKRTITDDEYQRSFNKDNSTWSAWKKSPTRSEVDTLNNRLTMAGIATTLNVASNNNAGDTCFFIFDRSDGIRYKMSFGTNGKLLYQKYENDAWSTVWEK